MLLPSNWIEKVKIFFVAGNNSSRLLGFLERNTKHDFQQLYESGLETCTKESMPLYTALHWEPNMVANFFTPAMNHFGFRPERALANGIFAILRSIGFSSLTCFMTQTL